LVGFLVALGGCPAPGTEPAEPGPERAQLAQTLAPGFQEHLVISGRTQPTAIRFARNGHVFVAEKRGLVFEYDDIVNGPVIAHPVIDIRNEVHDFWDRGLLGLAVHPNYPATPEIYLLYAHDAFADGTGPRWGDQCPDPPGATAHGCVVYGRLSRVVIDLGTMTGTEVPLISNKWCQQYPSHSVGDLHFGPDGYLYVSAGDGASFTFADYGQDGNPCGDPPNPVGAPDDVLATAEGGRLRSQDILSNGDPVGYGGSILRLDVSGQTVRIPPDNPLVGKGTTDDDAVVAIGLRNPFRWTFRPGTRELWIGDVGETTWEEIDRLIDPVASVTNFGWPCYEGPDERPVFRGNVLCDRVYARSFPGFVGAMTVPAPFLSYNHGETFVPGETACGTGTSSITGLAFNDQSLYPADYRNALFVADGSRRCIWTVAAGATGIPDPTRRAPFLELSGGTIVDLEMGLDGRLYYVDFDLGNIYRFDYSQGNQPPVAHLTASPTSGLPPLSVTLDASASTDTEDGANLTYAWDLDGDGVFDDGTRATVIHTFTQPGVITASVQVSDTLGASAVARVDIDVGNTPPTPVIASPSAALTWAVGQAISFAGSAADAQDGPLPDRALSWELIVHHCRSETMTDCHTHSIMTVNGVSSGSFTAPDHEWPSYLELRLTAFDSGSQWYDPAWPYRRALGIDSRAQASALTNIPVLVTLTPARIDYARTQTGGRDLRFTDSHGQVLSHEIESWNPGGTSLVWVRVPVLQPASNDNRIYVYYGNPTAIDAQRPTEVWSNGYVGVWHLGASLADSSSSGRAGIDHATSAVTGAVGAGTAFDGISSYIDLGTSTMFGLGGNVTVEAWAKLVTGGAENYPRIVSNKPVWDAGAGVSFELNPGLGACTLLGSGSDFARGQAQIDGQFHYYAASIAGTTGAVYTDGIDVTFDGVVSAAAPSSERLTIGRESAGSWFGGVIDEVRLSNVARSHDWVNAQYRSMIDQMISYGSEEPSTALGSSVSVVLQPRTSLVSMSSDPAGLTLQIGARVATTPLTGRFIVGSRQTVTAPSPQTLDGVSYTFAGWSDGQAATHSYDVPATDSALRTVYRAAGSPACGATRLTTASASASSLENASFPASAAIDGNPTTRWSSAFSDPQFLVVDLGAPRHISRVVLRWEAAASGDFDIDVADTATGPWLTVHTDHAGDGGVDDIAGLSAIGRYVRMYSRQRTLPYGNSLFELEVYGDNDPSCTPPPPDTRCGNTELPIASASASSLENASLAASAAIDGDLTTRWSSAFSDPQLIVVDLGAARHVSRVVLRWEIAASADYDLDVADSASGPWRTVYSDHAGNGGIDDIAGLNEDGRFVRMYSRARTTPFGNSLYELAVFGDPSVTCTP
jgi:glucose/arabinose dehydrogenase